MLTNQNRMLIMKASNQKDNTMTRRVECGTFQREMPAKGGAGSILLQKHLKTTSEWPQSGPVIPLPSNEVVFRRSEQQ